MATAPNPDQIQDQLEETQKTTDQKAAAFAEAGKKRFEENRAGVVPQEVYDAHRSPNDPDFNPTIAKTLQENLDNA